MCPLRSGHPATVCLLFGVESFADRTTAAEPLPGLKWSYTSPTWVAMYVVCVYTVDIEWAKQDLACVWQELTQQDQYQMAWYR